jgi:glutathione S-transferase
MSGLIGAAPSPRDGETKAGVIGTMRLIGMLDSPYVRRVAISLHLMGLRCDSEQVSVFRHFEAFAKINPVVKAPTLVTDDGLVLMDSTLILDYAERLVEPAFSLMPADVKDYGRAQRLIGLALAACEKSVQLVYERTLRPAEKQHQPWIDRVRGQMLAAYGALNAELGTGESWLLGARPLQADVTAAAVWRFTTDMLADEITATDYAALSRHAARAEALDAFRAYPPV